MKKAQEVANIFGVHYNTVMNWIRTDKIRAVKVGVSWRIPDEEIERIKRDGMSFTA